MSEGSGIEKLSLDQLEREITCGICQEYYMEPKVLPCLHYYCKQCILGLAIRTGIKKPFSCPECCSEATLPEDGVDGLKAAFFISRFKSMFSSLEQAQGRVEMRCESCISRSPAESFCQQCAVFLCKECSYIHQEMKDVAGHELVDVQGLNKRRPKVDITTTRQICVMKCPIHSEEFKLYCLDCEALICRECTIVNHRGHNFEFSTVAAPEMKEELMKELKALRQVGDGLSRAVEEMKSTRHEVEAQGVCGPDHQHLIRRTSSDCGESQAGAIRGSWEKSARKSGEAYCTGEDLVTS